MGIKKSREELLKDAEWAANAAEKARFRDGRLATAKALEDLACKLFAEIRALDDEGL